MRAAEPPRIVGWRDVIQPEGRERSWEEAVSLFGKRATQYAYILKGIELGGRLRSSVEVPTRIFLSYRHGSDERSRWVRDLAGALRQRGYEVVLDQDSDISFSPDIADLIAEMATCHAFIAIVDEDYLRSVPDSEDAFERHSWAYVEWRTAQMLTEKYGVRTLSFIYAGDRADRGKTISDGLNPGTAFMVDTPQKLKSTLDLFFPAVGTWDPAVASRADRLLSNSSRASFAGEHVEALRLAREAVAALPGNAETQRRLCLAAIAMNDIELAMRAAEAAAACAPGSTFVRYALIFACLLAGDERRVRSLIAEVEHLCSDSWRFRMLQLAHETVRRDAYAMHSCARSVTRLIDRTSWALEWRRQHFAIPATDRSVVEFAPHRPIPVAARDLRDPMITEIRQTDMAREVAGTAYRWVPRLRFAGDDAEPTHLADLDMLLCAYAAARWFPIAFGTEDWGVPKRAPDNAEGVFLLNETGQLIWAERRGDRG